MGDHHCKGRRVPRAGRLAILALLPALTVGLLWGSTATAAASPLHRHHHHHSHHRRHHHGHSSRLLPASSSRHHHGRHHQMQGRARHGTVEWASWCRHDLHCAAKHLYLHPHFALNGPVGLQIKGLPEAKWLKRFVRVGQTHHISPRILMSIGLIESYGGTTSTAYMGCLYPGTYGSWPKQIMCAAKVLDRVGLSGYDPSNAQYPSIIRAHARGILIRAH